MAEDKVYSGQVDSGWMLSSFDAQHVFSGGTAIWRTDLLRRPDVRSPRRHGVRHVGFYPWRDAQRHQNVIPVSPAL